MSEVKREDEATACNMPPSVSVSACSSNSDHSTPPPPPTAAAASTSSSTACSKSSGGKVKKFRLQIFSRFRTKEPEPKVQLYRRRTSSVGTEGEAMLTSTKKATIPKIPIESEPKSAPNLYF